MEAKHLKLGEDACDQQGEEYITVRESRSPVMWQLESANKRRRIVDDKAIGRKEPHGQSKNADMCTSADGAAESAKAEEIARSFPNTHFRR